MKKEGRVISKYIFEVRFAPLYTIIDRKGFFAENLSKVLDTDIIDFTEQRIDLYTPDRKIWGFLSATNCGFSSINPDSRTYFQDHATKFIKTLSALDGFSLEKINRVGIRSTYAAEYKGTFEELKNSYLFNLIDLKKAAVDIFGTNVSDVGLPLIFRSEEINFLTASGPMEKAQLVQFFKEIRYDQLPENSLYFDIDFYKDQLSTASIEDTISDLKKYTELGWSKLNRLKEVVFGQ